MKTKLSALQKKIVTLVISHWKKDFTGISALEISETIGKTHGEILSEAKTLKEAGYFHLREDVELYPVKFGVDEKGNFIHERTGKVMTAIVFPEKVILKKIFEKEKKDHGYYTNQLHLGDSQISLRFFKQEVLKKYFEQPEKYYSHDDIINGRIGTRDQYYFSLPEATRGQGKGIISQIRYGKRKLKNGDIAIAVILNDLSRLSLREQLYWASFEIDSPNFAEQDEEYDKFIRQSFLAEWIDYKDPLKQIVEAVKSINDLCVKKYKMNLFKKYENPRLKYPLFNNKGNYVEAHKELWKIVGSFNKPLLEELIKKRSIKEPDNYKKLKEFGLLKLVLSNLENDKKKIIIEPFEECNKNRCIDAHDIDEAQIEKIDYITKYKEDCKKLAKSLEELKLILQE